MVRLDYFRILEELAQMASKAVECANEGTESARGELLALRSESDKIICTLENALFTDFIPPLERDNIAAYAHCLSRVTDRASDYYAEIPAQRRQSLCRENDEARICVELAHILAENTTLLRKLKNPANTPDFAEFRKKLREGREAHNGMMAKLNSGILPRSFAQIIFATGRLRFELSRCFDELIEIMLNNI